MGRNSNGHKAVGATAGAQQLLGAMAMSRNGWGTTAMGHNSNRLLAVGATLGLDGSWAQQQWATPAGA